MPETYTKSNTVLLAADAASVDFRITVLSQPNCGEMNLEKSDQRTGSLRVMRITQCGKEVSSASENTVPARIRERCLELK